ncbi:MAG: 50S ribosomal protein L6 [Lewinellaceae bacterium]|nr:50S ribosomal protein L6 [Saprospiraceae bacterium]MCB9269731.1 50S ribosomal protein L6 [Lewinellaceae bacterium]HPG06613.1 50S ribosomal protein L6 [Saprospiraceae bacterium]
MSRIGKALITLPAGVTVDVAKNNLVTVKGPKGSLSQKIDVDLQVELDGNELSVKRPTNQKRHREIHGLSRALLANMVKGVSDGFTKNLELVGVGYRAANTGNLIEFSVGYSHPIYFYVPDELNVETATEKGKAPVIKLSGTDKQLLGQVAAKIRSYRKPEPYKGKGIKFSDEIIRRKAGKTAGK